MSSLHLRIKQIWQQNLWALRQPGSFTQNIALMFSGSALVTAVGLLLTPVMTRIYPPETYGTFAIYSLAIGQISLIATLSYPAAFVLPHSREELLALVQLTFVLVIATLFISCVGIAIWGPELMVWLKAEKLGNWFYAIPFLAFILSLNNIMANWYLRTKEFAKRAGVDIATNLISRGITIGYGVVIGGTAPGMLLGDILSRFVAFGSLLRGGMYRLLGELWRTFDWRVVRAAAIEYREYPLFQLPSAYINIVASQLPILLLTKEFGAAVTGLFAFCIGIIELPSTLMVNAIGPVFLQKATETHNDNPEAVPSLVLNLYYKLFYVGLVPFSVLAVYGDVIFRTAFGARWEAAGIFAGYMAYAYLVRLTSSATAPVYAIRRRQNLALIVVIVASTLRIAALGLGIMMKDARLTVLLFMVAGTVVPFLFDLYLLRLLGITILPVFGRLVGLIVIVFLLFYGLRQGLQAYWPYLRPTINLFH